jgi:formamidopyrimidine-DNA glycosylase
MRKFGGIWLAHDERELERIVDRLGPDWLDVSRSRFDELFSSRRRAIKAALIDQKIASGLGSGRDRRAVRRFRAGSAGSVSRPP